MNARRTVVRLTFDGVDISADINRYLQSLSYTDNEQDETDDLQLTLDDREGVWLGNWLNTPAASKGAELAAGDRSKKTGTRTVKTGCWIAARFRSTAWTGAARPRK